MNEYINLTLENIDEEHICCAIGDKKHQAGVDSKKEWIKSKLKDGHVFRKLNARGKIFIEYEPIETAWIPISGKNYEYIYCLWVAGSFKGKGIGKELIEYAINDSKEKGKSGICTLVSKKKKPFIGEKKFFEHYGFKVVDTIGDYELLALQFDDSETPRFNDNARTMKIDNQDFTIYYSNECPYVEYEVNELTEYAKENNIKIIGDLPIYVSYDSADVWAHPEEFQLDENLCPIEVAGCPPDGFSADGQLWGNPLFNWDYMKETGYQWWVNRIAYQSKIYDVIRIDHFRGFDEYYAIPYGDSTAKNGYWKPGPGMDLFTTIENKLGKLPIIAEDLGFLTDSVKQLLASTGFPGMKVLEFAFDSRDTGSGYLPHCYPNNCVVYRNTR